MEKVFLPVLHSFENNNIFTGSCGALRYKITPMITMKTQKEVDLEASTMKGEVWHGPFRYEKSTIEDERVFPISQQGREDLQDWLDSHI